MWWKIIFSLFCNICFSSPSFLTFQQLFCYHSLFSLQSGQPGTYILRQLFATVGQVQFVLPHIYPSVQYEVYSQEPQLTVEPLSGLNLLCDRHQDCIFVRAVT